MSKWSQQKQHERSRVVLPGFPKSPFTSREQIKEYFSEDKITCLLCGKQYGSLTAHLQVHELDSDGYKEMFNLPWRRGLVGRVTHEIKCEKQQARLATGWVPNKGADVTKMHTAPRRKEVFKSEIARSNLKDKLGSIKHNTDGNATQRLYDSFERMGSEASKQKRIRIAKEKFISGECGLVKFTWKGKTQSDEHLARRLLRTMGIDKSEIDPDILEFGVQHARLSRTIKNIKKGVTK